MKTEIDKIVASGGFLGVGGTASATQIGNVGKQSPYEFLQN